MHCEVHTGHGNGKHCDISKEAEGLFDLTNTPGLEDIECIQALAASIWTHLAELKDRTSYQMHHQIVAQVLINEANYHISQALLPDAEGVADAVD